MTRQPEPPKVTHEEADAIRRRFLACDLCNKPIDLAEPMHHITDSVYGLDFWLCDRCFDARQRRKERDEATIARAEDRWANLDKNHDREPIGNNKPTEPS